MLHMCTAIPCSPRHGWGELAPQMPEAPRITQFQLELALRTALGFGGPFCATFWHILFHIALDSRMRYPQRLRRLALAHAGFDQLGGGLAARRHRQAKLLARRSAGVRRGARGRPAPQRQVTIPVTSWLAGEEAENLTGSERSAAGRPAFKRPLG